MRVAVWYRYGDGKRAVEAYVEQFRRRDDASTYAEEFDGFGGGVGMTLF
ncbi:MAG: hypothetical protein NT062_28005 [Proteobacteria bacterium]|nr:hypothetical protein [Pseudomonadota bacterium]